MPHQRLVTEIAFLARQLFTVDIIPYLVRTLQGFTPPYPSPPPLFATPGSRKFLVQVDLESLEQATGQLERLALDFEEVKVALARGYVSPENGSDSTLARMLAFIEHGAYPPFWSDVAQEELEKMQKGFDMCKAAVIRAVVEVAGDDKNTTVLWDKSKEGKPGGEFVDTMVRWIRTHKDLDKSERDDLLVCALVNLGNLCRNGTPPHQV